MDINDAKTTDKTDADNDEKNTVDKYDGLTTELKKFCNEEEVAKIIQLIELKKIDPEEEGIWELVAFPKEVHEHMLFLEDFFDEKRISSINALSNEILHWIVQQHLEGFVTKAERENEKDIEVREIPLKLIHDQNNDKKKTEELN